MDHQRKRNYERITELGTGQLQLLSGTFCCQTKLLYICVKLNKVLLNKFARNSFLVRFKRVLKINF